MIALSVALSVAALAALMSVGELRDKWGSLSLTGSARRNGAPSGRSAPQACFAALTAPDAESGAHRAEICLSDVRALIELQIRSSARPGGCSEDPAGLPQAGECFACRLRRAAPRRRSRRRHRDAHADERLRAGLHARHRLLDEHGLPLRVFPVPFRRIRQLL